MGSGASLIVGGVALIVVGWLSRLGRLPRNGLVGLRTPSTMRTKTAWREGHAAAAGELLAAGWVAVIGGILVGTLPEFGDSVTLATAGAVVALVLHAAHKAIQTARTVPRDLP